MEEIICIATFSNNQEVFVPIKEYNSNPVCYGYRHHEDRRRSNPVPWDGKIHAVDGIKQAKRNKHYKTYGGLKWRNVEFKF